MRTVGIAFLIFLVIGVGFIPSTKIYDDGLWPLSVTVRSSSGRPIKGVSAEAFGSIADAQERLADPPPLAATRFDHSIYSAVQEQKADEPLKVNIPTSEKSHGALLWTYRSFFQFRGLLVVAEYETGKLEARAFEIPDLRQARSVTVEVP